MRNTVCSDENENHAVKCLFLNFLLIFSAEVLVTGVARLALGAGRANLVHRLASIVTSYGVVTDSQGLVGQEWPHLFRVVAEATADLVSVSPDNLGVVASVMGKPRVTLSIIIGPQPTRQHPDLTRRG